MQMKSKHQDFIFRTNDIFMCMFWQQKTFKQMHSLIIMPNFLDNWPTFYVKCQ